MTYLLFVRPKMIVVLMVVRQFPFASTSSTSTNSALVGDCVDDVDAGDSVDDADDDVDDIEADGRADDIDVGSLFPVNRDFITENILHKIQ